MVNATLSRLEKAVQNKREAFVNIAISVTRLGDLLGFGQLFKAFGYNYFAQISHILRHFL